MNLSHNKLNYKLWLHLVLENKEIHSIQTSYKCNSIELHPEILAPILMQDYCC